MEPIHFKLICEQITQEATQNAARSDWPDALLLVGQKYSGADRLIPLMLENIQWDKPPAVVNFADFICDHPNSLNMMMNPGLTRERQYDCHIRDWTMRALDALIERDCGIIYLGDPSDDDTLRRALMKLRFRGYRVTLAAMAVSEKISILREVADYHYKIGISQPTITPHIRQHKSTARHMPLMVGQIERDYLTDTLKVYNDELEEIYSNSLDLDDIIKQGRSAFRNARAAILHEQRRGLTDEEKSACLEMLARIINSMNERRVLKAYESPASAANESLVTEVIDLFWDDIESSSHEELKLKTLGLRPNPSPPAT